MGRFAPENGKREPYRAIEIGIARGWGSRMP